MKYYEIQLDNDVKILLQNVERVSHLIMTAGTLYSRYRST